MRKRLVFALSLALCVLFAPCASGQQAPKAIVTGPKESSAGDLVILDASESVGTSRLWLLAVSPVQKSFLPVDSGTRCVFATSTAGRYVFVLVVAGTGPNGNALAEMATHTLDVTGAAVPPGPIPNPTPPPSTNPYPTPAGKLLTAAKVVAEVKTDRSDATLLATLYQSASRLVSSASAARAAGTKPEIGTTAELRAWLVSSGKELGLRGKYDGLADAVDKYLAQQLGTKVRDVTEADAAAMTALAWGVWEGGK